MASNALKKITTRAKQIRKAHPKMDWRTAVKKAGAEYRGGKKSPAKKRAAVKSKPAASRTRSVGSVAPVIAGTGQTIAGIRSTAIKLLESKYGQLAIKKMKETKVRARKALQKQMTAVLKQIRQFSKI